MLFVCYLYFSQQTRKANQFVYSLDFSYLCLDISKAHRLFFSNQNLDNFDAKKNLS